MGEGAVVGGLYRTLTIGFYGRGMLSTIRRLFESVAFSVVLLSVATAHAASPDDFFLAFSKRVELYEPATGHPDNFGDALQGYPERAHRRLEAVVPDSEKTPIDYLILGNLFHRADPDRSFDYHRRALRALPEQPEAALEMAYEYHRRDDCAQATPLYQLVVSALPAQSTVQALLAHCLVKLGRYAESIEAWKASNHQRNHTAIDFAIHQVFGEPVSALARHGALMQRFRSGETAVATELLEGALQWEGDWWNRRTNWDAVRAVMQLAEQQLGSDSPLLGELRLTVRALGERNSQAFAAQLKQENLILEGGRLPQSSYVAYKLIEAALKRKLIERSELATRFLEELKRRARTPAGDQYALILLGHLLAFTGRQSELPEFDLLGWQRHRLPGFALSYLDGRQIELGDGFTHEDEMLRQAIRDFPDDSRFALLAFELASKAGVATPDHLARLIDAEFRGLRSSPQRYSYALKSYFKELDERL